MTFQSVKGILQPGPNRLANGNCNGFDFHCKYKRDNHDMLLTMLFNCSVDIKFIRYAVGYTGRNSARSRRVRLYLSIRVRNGKGSSPNGVNSQSPIAQAIRNWLLDHEIAIG